MGQDVFLCRQDKSTGYEEKAIGWRETLVLIDHVPEREGEDRWVAYRDTRRIIRERIGAPRRAVLQAHAQRVLLSPISTGMSSSITHGQASFSLGSILKEADEPRRRARRTAARWTKRSRPMAEALVHVGSDAEEAPGTDVAHVREDTNARPRQPLREGARPTRGRRVPRQADGVEIQDRRPAGPAGVQRRAAGVSGDLPADPQGWRDRLRPEGRSSKRAADPVCQAPRGHRADDPGTAVPVGVQLHVQPVP